MNPDDFNKFLVQGKDGFPSGTLFIQVLCSKIRFNLLKKLEKTVKNVKHELYGSMCAVRRFNLTQMQPIDIVYKTVCIHIYSVSH